MLTMQHAIQTRLIEYLEQKQWTVSELARRASLSQSTVNSIIKENVRNPSIQSLFQLSAAFGINLSEFFDSPLFENIAIEAMKTGRSKER